MIFRSEGGYPSDETGDQGDSARAAGILMTFGFSLKEHLLDYINDDGWVVRSPLQHPWDNPFNCTRDQIMCVVAGLWSMNTLEATQKARAIFWAHARRFFFSQNFERDKVGTTKYPWPHSFINDQGKKEIRSFDFADPNFLHHIGHLILCARLYWLFPFVWLICWPFFFLTLLLQSRKIDAEQNQIQCMVKVAGSFWCGIYRFLNPNWAKQTFYYWERRKQIEYAFEIRLGILGIKNGKS